VSWHSVMSELAQCDVFVAWSEQAWCDV